MSRQATRAAGLLLAVAVVSGCSGPDVPSGWSEDEVGSLTLAHPDGWVALPEDELSGEFWQAALQDSAGEDAQVQLLLGPDYSDDGTAGSAADRLVAAAQIGVPFEGWSSQGRTDVDVPGASSAERWDFTYTGADGDTITGVWVFVADDETDRAGAIQLTGTTLDERLVFDLVNSLRFDPGADPVAGAEQA